MVRESQKRASAKWDEENKEKKKYISHRARARSFVRDVATIEDIEEFEQLLHIRKEALKKEK